MKNYLEINKKSWNTRLESHLSSEFYDVEGFLKGKNSLNPLELELLGDIRGKTILHLQCHFGQDTISLSRLGAEVTGVDFSEPSIEKARELATTSGENTTFICTDIYNLPTVLDQKFDLVFTSYGTISWLPDLTKWSEVVAHFLKPGGKFVFAEFHPAVWMYDDAVENITYHYNNIEPIVEEETGTYADKNAAISAKCVCWNHGIGEVVTNLINSGLVINQLDEFCHSPYPFIEKSEMISSGKYRIKHFGDKFPLVYALSATRS